MKCLQLFILFFFITLSSCAWCPDDLSELGSDCKYCCSLNEIRCQPKTGHGSFKFVYYENQSLSIVCENSPDWSELSINGIDIGQYLDVMVFTDCHLPTNEQLVEIFQQFRIISVDKLQLLTQKNQTNYWNLNRDNLRRFVNITKLSIMNYYLTNPQSDLLYDLQNLNDITLGNNAIEEIPVNFFQKLNLTKVYSIYNKLQFIKANDFDKVECMEELHLDNNEIEKIDRYSFNNLIHLKEINIQSNRLNTLPRNLFDHQEKLEVIDLSSNNFSSDSLPQKLLRNQSQLETFRLYDNKIKLKTLPNKFFLNLNKLKRVLLHNNAFTSLPDDLFINTTSISMIVLNNNSLTTIPENLFYDCKNLKTIELNFNDIKYLPSRVFSGLEKLVELELSNNRLNTIQRNLFNDLSSLKTLNIENNHLKTIEDGVFDHLITLENAKFSKNKLTFLPSFPATNISEKITSPFENATSLKKLDLSHNMISHIFKDWLQSKSLTTLNLSFNNLIKLEVRDLDFNAIKLKVDLSNNNIKDILLEGADELSWSFKITKNIKIQLDNNPLNCSCNIYHLLRYSEGKMKKKGTNLFILDIDNLRCNEPNILNERLVKQLESDEIIETLSCYKNSPPKIITSKWLIGGCIVITLIGILTGIIYYHYQRDIKIWLYEKNWCLWWVTEREIDKDKIYDAFISYSHMDDDFVVNKLVQNLENGQRYKLCVHYRDWPAGEWIADQVVRSVASSRRTIVVLSENFLNSEWAKMEFRTAHRQALSDGTTRLIIVVYGELSEIPMDDDIKHYLRMNTYVKWGDPWFWEKLKYALPHARNNTSLE